MRLIMIKVAIDTMGGDLSPDANVDGALAALEKISDLEIYLVGDETAINQKLQNKKYDKERVKIVHAPDVIDCHDKPTEAIRRKTDSSMVKCIELLKSEQGVNAMVSTGSTGALLAGAVLKIGRIPGVKRPAFCPLVPTVTGDFVALCDSGANIECDETQLTQFAVMGNLYLKKAYGIKSPRVVLLNVGTEEEKGDELRKTVYQNLKNDPEINFVGNMESRDFISGKYDLIVCDGFSGNVLLKATEGGCLELLKLLKKTIKKNLKTKMGALLMKKELTGIKNLMDYNNYGGAVLLGCKKTVVKGHGSSKALSVFHCVEQAYNMEKNNLREAIAEEMEKSRAKLSPEA